MTGGGQLGMTVGCGGRLGMTVALLVNSHRLHDYATELLIHSGGTIKIKGPWFANMDLLLTTDPLDVNHVLSKNFKNYPKGDKLRQIFDILGDGIISSDGKTWEISRKVTMSTFNHSRFQSMLETIIWNKVESGLLPTLESICAHGIEIDLQDIFQRFAFDTTCKLLFDEDMKSLSPNFPYAPCLKALTDAEEAILLRHITPTCLWTLQQLLRVGKEHKLSNGWKTVDQFIYKFLEKKQNEYNKSNLEYQVDGEFQLLTTLVREFKLEYGTSLNPTTFLRDYIVNLMAAGKDTTSSALSWFFYNLMKNPIIEEKILREIHTHFKVKAGERWHVNELNKLVYLHGALCESLRLFPPGPFNHKSPLQPDILPSGNQDCMEFKPERWITEKGTTKHEPSYKFTAFNAGPRTCVGKNVAFSHLKIVSTVIIYSYHIELVKGHLVLPADSIVLQMKHGLKVKLTRRSDVN
ncbi:cytochrome P450 [Artemisia annua]|uniref:Cytochrome P450 n=1 Tax=Artemisia annua TaxID=35608 RepID=A0A2U1L495_ARTAN|nr:cytochrome P450 [Artemisia annua]